MKKIIHKNQVVITTLAVLIAIAGYVSYDRKSGGAEETKTVANMKEDALSDGMEDNYDDIAADISDGESVALASTESGEEPTGAYECGSRKCQLCGTGQTQSRAGSFQK